MQRVHEPSTITCWAEVSISDRMRVGENINGAPANANAKDARGSSE